MAVKMLKKETQRTVPVGHEEGAVSVGGGNGRSLLLLEGVVVVQLDLCKALPHVVCHLMGETPQEDAPAEVKVKGHDRGVTQKKQSNNDNRKILVHVFRRGRVRISIL